MAGLSICGYTSLIRFGSRWLFFIEVNISTKGEKIYVSIFNSGRPISESDINHIWDRFYKGDKSRTNKVSTGLGLSIVRLILTQHNQDVWANNVDGKGIKFTFTLERSN